MAHKKTPPPHYWAIFLVPIQKAYDTGGKTTSSFELSTSKEGSNEAPTDRPEFSRPGCVQRRSFREVAVLEFLRVRSCARPPPVLRRRSGNLCAGLPPPLAGSGLRRWRKR